ELLIGVAHAVAPGERRVLDQEASLGVVHALLGHLVGRGARQLARPEVGHRLSRAEVARLVEHERLAGVRIDEPAQVDGRARPANGPCRWRAPLASTYRGSRTGRYPSRS